MITRFIEVDGSTISQFLHALRERRVRFSEDVAAIAARIIRDVEKRGDQALIENARRFDAPEASHFQLMATAAEISDAAVEPHQLAAILEAIRRVTEFHEAQLKVVTSGWTQTESDWRWTIPAGKTADCGYEGQRMVPLASAGVYVPGGKGTYPSSVIMNCIPAKVAGVAEIVMATPARRDGTLHPAVLVAAREVGIRHVLKVGGAAAIAGLASGFNGVDPVDVIVGPGNVYVNEAKRQMWGRVGLDGYAGPSEVCVLVDESADEEFAAADLLTQVEHSEDNSGYLIGLQKEKVEAVLEAADRQMTGHPREKTMRAALNHYGMAVLAPDLRVASDVIDAIAPEHLTLMIKDPESLMPKIHNAGCILLGDHTPQSAGDFASGPSHTLPTAGAARHSSPVSVLNFLKVQSIGCLSASDLEEIAPVIQAFGEMEGFPAHAAGAAIRLKRRRAG